MSLRQVGEARSEIQEMSPTDVGTVSVGAIPTIAPYFLAPILARLVQRRPNISVRIAEEITPVLLDHLHNDCVDFVLLARPIRGDEFLCEEIFREPCLHAFPRATGWRRAGRSTWRRSAANHSCC